MQLGAAPRPRPQLVNLNVLPREFRRRPFPLLTVGLSLVVLGAVLLLYGVFYLKTYADWEVDRLRDRVAQAQDVVRAATGDEAAAAAERDRLLAARQDYLALVERQVGWSKVLAAVGDTPPGIALDSLSQSGYDLTVRGSAPDYAAATQYLERLRATDLFLNLSIEISGAAAPEATREPTLTAWATRPPSGTSVPAAVAATSTRTPTPTFSPSPPSPTASPTPGSPTATLTPTPAPTQPPVLTPAFDYAVESKAQKPRNSSPSEVNYIRGRIVDENGAPVSGLKLRISSDAGNWSADGPSDGRSNGTFEFVVTRGKFGVQILGVRSEVASGLFTGSTDSSESFDWEIVFKKVPPVPTPTGTPGTPTASPTSSATPISPGRNIASEASISVSNNGNDARLAVDGDLNTAWNAQTYPPAAIRLDFGTTRQVEGIELVLSQNPTGSTTHEIWIKDETGNWVDSKPFTTLESTTKDYQVLAYRFSPIRSVSSIYIRTIRGPSFVAWREVRVYEPLPSPDGSFYTATPTVTPTPTITPTPTDTLTPTITPTPTNTPTPDATQTSVAATATSAAKTVTAAVALTATADAKTATAAGVASQTLSATSTRTPTPTHTETPTATPTATSTPTATPDVDPVALAIPASQAVSTLDFIEGHPPALAIDGDANTYWLPKEHINADYLRIDLESAGYASASDEIARIEVVAFQQLNPPATTFAVQTQAASGGATTKQCEFNLAGDAAFQTFDCPIASPLKGVRYLFIQVPPSSGTVGVAEVRVWKVRRSAQSSGPLEALQSFVRGLGLGPGLAPTPSAAASPSSGPSRGTTGPSGRVEFAILLETKSGEGYR